jgi:hypothetical protein
MQKKVFVARGRTVCIGDAKHGPGELISLDAVEAEHLKERGFVQDAPPILTPPQVENPAGIGHRDPLTQGLQFRS